MPPSWARVPLELLEALAEPRHAKVLSWLRRDLAADASFAAAVEMALGLSALECPEDLWVADDGEGHVRETEGAGTRVQ